MQQTTKIIAAIAISAFMSIFVVACNRNGATAAETTANELCDCAKELIDLSKNKKNLTGSEEVMLILKMEKEAKKVTECMVAIKRKSDEQIKSADEKAKEAFANEVDTLLHINCPDLVELMQKM
jgi:hypothetical protein